MENRTYNKPELVGYSKSNSKMEVCNKCLPQETRKISNTSFTPQATKKKRAKEAQS